MAGHKCNPRVLFDDPGNVSPIRPDGFHVEQPGVAIYDRIAHMERIPGDFPGDLGMRMLAGEIVSVWESGVDIPDELRPHLEALKARVRKWNQESGRSPHGGADSD